MLSELIIKHAKPKDKKYCISDGVSTTLNGL